MYRSMRFKLGIWFCIAVLGCLAVAGGVFLGRFYIGLIEQSNVPEDIKVNANAAKPVVVPNDEKFLMLTTVPVYYLQVGVYSDLKRAQEAAEPLRELGYNPYITQTPPLRLWLGVYQKRADTEFIKQQLKDKGFGSFTASIVINGSNLRYNKGTEAFIQQVSPVLEQYTVWLKDNLALFDTDSVERLNWNQVNQQLNDADKACNNLLTLTREVTTNNPEINKSLSELTDTVGGYQAALQQFHGKKDQQSYAELQNNFLRFIDNYVLFWEKLDNISKT